MQRRYRKRYSQCHQTIHNSHTKHNEQTHDEKEPTMQMQMQMQIVVTGDSLLTVIVPANEDHTGLMNLLQLVIDDNCGVEGYRVKNVIPYTWKFTTHTAHTSL